jgi:hypothetical protein
MRVQLYAISHGQAIDTDHNNVRVWRDDDDDDDAETDLLHRVEQQQE